MTQTDSAAVPRVKEIKHEIGRYTVTVSDNDNGDWRAHIWPVQAYMTHAIYARTADAALDRAMPIIVSLIAADRQIRNALWLRFEATVDDPNLVQNLVDEAMRKLD